MAFAIIMLAGCASDFAGIDWDDLDDCGVNDVISASATALVRQSAVLQTKKEVLPQTKLAGRESLVSIINPDFSAARPTDRSHDQTRERAPPIFKI